MEIGEPKADLVIPRVFISYSHDSPEHSRRVLELSDRLRADGVDCMVDQYEPFPPEGWPEWMTRQVEISDFVIVICTETYGLRFRRNVEPGVGLGAKWEGSIITQLLYDSELGNRKFIPVVLRESDRAHIPLPLRGSTHFDIGTSTGYDRLYRLVSAQPEVTKPQLGPVRTLPDDLRRTFPAIVEDVENSASVILSGSNYVFRVFNIGERGTVLAPKLVDEVLQGLRTRISPIASSLDYVTAEDPGGIRWGLLLARELGLTLRMITSTSGGIRDQVRVTQELGFYAGRTLWFPKASPGERTVVIDDVIDTGGTMKTMVDTLRQQGVEVAGIFAIVGKSYATERLERDLGIPVSCLLQIDGW